MFTFAISMLVGALGLMALVYGILLMLVDGTRDSKPWYHISWR